MTTIADDIAQVWREYVTYGVSASGANEPVKQEIRALMHRVDLALSTLGVAVGGAITVKYATLTELEADLDHAEGTLAIVYDDDRSPSESGIYAKVGASGTGSWELTDVALPADFSADLAYVLSQLELLQDALTRSEAAAAAAAASAIAAAISELNAAGSAVLAEYWANIAEASAFGPFLTDLSDVDAVNAYLQANAGQTIRVFAAPGPYHEPNFLATGDPIIVPANTCLLADGIVEIRSDNPTRQVFHLEGDGAKILGNFRLIGDYIPIGEYAWQDGSDFFNWSSGSQTSRPNFEWGIGEYTPWALAWNEAHPDFPITAYAVMTWDAAWNAAMPQSQYANLGALSKNNRTAAITSYDASSLIVDGPYISNFHTSVTFQGNNITALSAADTASLQTYGNILRNLTLDQFDFGILCKKQRDFNIDGIKTEWIGWRVNRGQPHLIYLSNSTDVYEESWNVSVGTVYAVNYEGGSVFKARGCKNLTWGAILCRSVHSAIAIVEACTGAGGTVLVTDQHQTTDIVNGAGSKFAVNITNSPGFIIEGAVRIQQRAGEDQMKGISVENSSGARFLQGSEVVCARATDEDFLHRVRTSSYVYSGPTKYTDTNGRNALLWTMSDSQEEGGNASNCVLEFGQITGTTKLAKFLGLSANNQAWVDPTKVATWNATQALVDDGLGGGNVLIDPRATARKVLAADTDFDFTLKSSSTLTIQREGPDPLDEDALPPPYVFSDGDEVEFAGRTYTWRDVLSTGPTVPNEILIPSATIVAAYPLMTAAYGYLQIAFLNAAVMGVLYKTAGEGVIYSTGTAPHALVESEWGGNQFNIRALDGGTAPNAYTTTVSMTGDHASWDGPTLSGGGGADDSLLNQIVVVTTGVSDKVMTLSETAKEGSYIEFVKVDPGAGAVDCYGLATLEAENDRAVLTYEAGEWRASFFMGDYAAVIAEAIAATNSANSALADATAALAAFADSFENTPGQAAADELALEALNSLGFSMGGVRGDGAFQFHGGAYLTDDAYTGDVSFKNSGDEEVFNYSSLGLGFADLQWQTTTEALFLIVNSLGFAVIEVDSEGNFIVADGDTPTPPPFVAPDVNPIIGGELFLASDGPLPLYVRNVLTCRTSDTDNAAVTLSTDTTPPAIGWAETAREGSIGIAYDVGSPVTLTVRATDNRQDRIIKDLTASSIAVPVSGSPAPKLLFIGDSITNRRTAAYVEDYLIDWGVAPFFVGTMTGGGGFVGPLGEGREGWSLGDFLGTDMSSDDVPDGVLAVGDEAAYLALPNNDKRYINPFLRPATGGDDPALIVTIDGLNYVFDLAFYISRFSLSTPDVVILNLGMNDLLENAPVAALASIVSNYPRMLDAIRSAFPSAVIICWATIMPPSTAGDQRWDDSWADILTTIVDLVATRQATDTDLHLVSAWAHQTAETAFALDTGTAGAAGTTDTDVTDPIHPTTVAVAQHARAIAAAITCLI